MHIRQPFGYSVCTRRSKTSVDTEGLSLTVDMPSVDDGTASRSAPAVIVVADITLTLDISQFSAPPFLQAACLLA